MTPYSLMESEDPIATIMRVDDRGSMIFWNISTCPHEYKTSHLRRQQFSRIRIILINFSEDNGLCGTISSYSWDWWHYVPQIFWWSGEMDRLPLFSLLWLNLKAQQNNYYQWNMHVLGVGQLFWYIFAKNEKWVHTVDVLPIWRFTGFISRTTLCLLNDLKLSIFRRIFSKSFIHNIRVEDMIKQATCFGWENNHQDFSAYSTAIGVRSPPSRYNNTL